MTPEFVTIKIGGSLFSDKSRPGHIDRAALSAYAEMVAGLTGPHPGRLVLITGGGAFGHGAIRNRARQGRHGLVGLTEACFAVKWHWTEALRAAGVTAFPLQLAAMCTMAEDTPHVHPEVLRALLRSEVVPVLSGDAVLNAAGELESFSSDRVPEVVQASVGAAVRVVVLTDVPGILTGPGRDQTLPEVDARDPADAYAALWTRSEWDSTGAMHSKLGGLITCARNGAESFIMRGDDARKSPGILFAPTAEWPVDLRYTRIADPSLGRGQR